MTDATKTVPAEATGLQWSAEKQPTEDCPYNHIAALVPFGFVRIEWQAWKEDTSYVVNYASDGDRYIETCDSLDEAKAKASQAISEERLGCAPPVSPPADLVERVALAAAPFDGTGWVVGVSGARVKPLEWIHNPEIPSFRALSIVGPYRVSPSIGEWRIDDAPHTDEIPSAMSWRFKTPRAAKAACQADYECRILSALELAPSPDTERDRLRELLAKVRDTGLIYWEPNTDRGHVSKAQMLAEIDAALNGGDNG